MHIGEMHWNKTTRSGKRGRGGRKNQIATQKSEYVVIPDFCDPIIDRRTWDAVQVRLKKERDAYHRNGGIVNANHKRSYLLSGSIVCAECGAKYTTGAVRSGAPAYRCPTHKMGSVCANTTVVSQPGLEARVRHIFETVIKDRSKLAALVAEHNGRIQTSNDTLMIAVSKLEQELKTKRMQEERYAESVGAGDGEPIPVLVRKLKELQDACTALEQKIQDARARVQPHLEPLADVLTFESGNALLLQDEGAVTDAEQRKRIITQNKLLLARVLETILVYPDGALYVKFKTEGLFGPVEGIQLRAVKPPSSTGQADIKADRHAFREAFDGAQNPASYEHVVGSFGAEGEPPLYASVLVGDAVMDLVQGVPQSLRDIPPFPASLVDDPIEPEAPEAKTPTSRPDRKVGVTLASPRGFEPLLAT